MALPQNPSLLAVIGATGGSEAAGSILWRPGYDRHGTAEGFYWPATLLQRQNIRIDTCWGGHGPSLDVYGRVYVVRRSRVGGERGGQRIAQNDRVAWGGDEGVWHHCPYFREGLFGIEGSQK